MIEATRLHLVRHGQVAEAWQGRIYGDHDVPLSKGGEDEARRAARALAGLELAAVISSGLARAEFGAALLRESRSLPRRDVPELREISRGEWRGKTFQDLEAGSPGAMRAWTRDPSARPPGGESLDDLRKRVIPALEALAGEFVGLEVGVIAHSWVIRVATAEALGLPPGGAHRMDLPTAGIVSLDWPGSPGQGAGPVLAGFACPDPAPRAKRWHRGPRGA